jgi:hypothetical protein
MLKLVCYNCHRADNIYRAEFQLFNFQISFKDVICRLNHKIVSKFLRCFTSVVDHSIDFFMLIMSLVLSLRPV